MNNIQDLKPFKRICMTIGNLPTAYIESMSYYECLTYLVKYLTNEVIPTVNNNSEVVKELQTYVATYFDNLDVQEEINNKLDEMATSGELTEVIGQFLTLAGIHVYNTIDDLKDAENLIDGSICETLGYNDVGDGGSAKYLIRELNVDEETDEMLLIELNNSDTLIAELVLENTITPQMLGAKANSNHDDREILEKTFEIASEKGIEVQLLGSYYIKSALVINTNGTIMCNGSKPTIGTLLQEQNDSFSNIIFDNNGYIETRGITNITFQNVCFSGSNAGIIFKSFRNRLINCSFNGFTNAISIENGLNWNGENVIELCTFNSVTNCIKLNSGSDGDINGCLADGKCTSFISGGYDSGYKIQNNHDYTTQGSILTGNNTLIVGNYIDGFNKLEITGNGGFTITGNMFYGTAPESGTNYAIKFSNANTISSGTINGNTLSTGNNNSTNDYLYFIDITNLSYFSNVNISGNNITISKGLFSGATPSKIYSCLIDQAIKVNTYNVNAKATITDNYGLYSNSIGTFHTVLTLDELTSAEVIRYENKFDNFIHIIKMDNETDYRIEFSDSNSVYARGDYSQATGMEVWSIGMNENSMLPFTFIP